MITIPKILKSIRCRHLTLTQIKGANPCFRWHYKDPAKNIDVQKDVPASHIRMKTMAQWVEDGNAFLDTIYVDIATERERQEAKPVRFEFDYEELAKYLPGSFMPSDEVLRGIESYLTERPILHSAHGSKGTCWGYGALAAEVKHMAFIDSYTLGQVCDILDGQNRVWINVMTGRISHSWPTSEDKGIDRDYMEDSTESGWRLITYNCENMDSFEFTPNMKLIGAGE